MEDFKNLEEIMVASEEIFDGHVVHLFKDTVELPNGKLATRETVRHIGAVAVVPLTDDGKVIVERQFRYPLGCVITEIPAGKLDSKDEDRLSAAKRELQEETGYTAEETDPASLAAINEIKETVASPLARLCDSLDGAVTVRDFATAVFVYLEELGIREKSLEPTMVRYFGVDKTAEAIRLWNMTMEALDTLVDAAGDEETTAADFHTLVRLLFSAIDVAEIPNAKDQIIIGNADTIRIDERNIVLLLGAVEGVFPAPVSESPTLCENERSILEENGVSLSQTLRLRSARELFHFVRAIDFATERVVISHYAADADGRSS